MTTLDSTAVEALGWALVHFAWQGVLAAAVFALLNAAAHGAGARVRYALAAFTLAAMAVMPPLTVLLTRGPGREIGPAAALHAGCYVHGLAADVAVRDLGEYAMLAGDIIERLPAALRALAEGTG